MEMGKVDVTSPPPKGEAIGLNGFEVFHGKTLSGGPCSRPRACDDGCAHANTLASRPVIFLGDRKANIVNAALPTASYNR
jgi:hypothetical protein